MGETIRGRSIGTWLGTSAALGIYVCSRRKADFGSHVEKILKNVDNDEPTSFLDHVYLGCTKRECKPNETVIEEYTEMFQ